MGISVTLILIMISRTIRHAHIESQKEISEKEAGCPEPILIDECSVLDVENNYQDFKHYKNLKVIKKESNDYSQTTEGNSNNHAYSFSQKNCFDYKKLDNDIEDFMNENTYDKSEGGYDKISVEGKVYHQKDQFLII